MGGDLPLLVNRLTSGSVPSVLVAMGSPYVLPAFPQASASVATFNTTPPSEISVATEFNWRPGFTE